ncbi:hypothetical protein BDV26DRAFT_271298 [Aspergillus bertholletiae]|uniref:DUF1214 domain-containing protein n=1 Tax=Aspergillus bertholletiae TaxID=1226010 RepID=A0A5N7AVE6_9EURO|nr:hypothetical protein BDV26DRAFT_271298 [Aspergillus bertholletiae]
MIYRYGDNYANIGSASGSSAGKYLVQYSTARSLPPGLHLCNMAVKIHGNFCKKGFQGVISPPGVYGTLLARFRIENNGTDVAKVHALQNRTSLTCQGGDRPGVQAPSLSPAMMNASLSSQEPTRALQLTARVAPFNPPRNISDLPRVTRMLRAAGIHNGEYQPQVPNLTALGASVKKIVAGISTLPENTMHLQNGWTQLAPQVQGDYGKNYAMRLYVAYSGYLCLRASEALYPMYTPSGNQEVKLTLGPEEAYIVTFSSKPPLATKGFWSLTAYNSQKFLINNPLGRYSVGDRTELTYPDGIPVYGNQSSHDDGSFQVLIQPADTQPPANWTSK